MNLYQISNEYLKLLDREEYSVEDMQLLQTVDGNFKDKAIAVAAYIENTKAEVLAIQCAIEKMEKRSESRLNKVNFLMNYLKDMMVRCDIKEIVDHPEFELKIKANPPKVDIIDQKLIPAEYFVVKTSLTPDKKLIKAALDKEQAVPGTRIVQETRLEIK